MDFGADGTGQKSTERNFLEVGEQMASKNIKGITIEIGANTTQLDKELKKADKSISQVANELKEVDKALKLNPGNTELVAQKQKLLADQVRQTAEKLKTLHDAQEQVEEQFKSGKISAEQYRAFEREVSNTEAALRKLRNESEEYRRSNTNLARASETVTANIKNLANAVRTMATRAKEAAEVGLKAMQVSLKAVSAEVEVGLKAFKAYVTGLTTATTALGAFAVKSGADFEQSMSKVEALTGATGKDLEELRDKAKEMGASTSKSAAESADALGYMALAGWDNKQMLEGLEPILRASEAGTMDLATCSDLVTDSMSAMGIQTQDLNHYLDVVSKTQSSANTSMQGMLEAYVAAGGTFKNMNVPLEESATLIGILANRGIKGAEAGNSINSVLVNLMGASGKAADALEQLGVSMYDAEGNRKSVTETLKELNTALENGTEAQRDMLTAAIGGKTQMDTLQALLAGVSEEYDDLNGKIMNADGSLMQTAQTMQDNFKGAITSAKSALEGLGISMFETFSPALTEQIRVFTGYVSKISDAIQNGGIISAILDIRNSLIKTVKDSMSELAKNVKEGTGIFNTVILSVIDVISAALPGLTDQVLPALLEGMFNLINGLIDRLPSLIPALIALALALVRGLLEGLNESVSLLAAELPEILKNVFEQITADMPYIMTTGIQIILTLIDAITDMIPDLIPMAVQIIMTLVNSLLGNIDKIIDSALKLILALCDAILDNLDLVIDATIQIIIALAKAIVDNLDKIIEAAITILITLGAALVDSAGRLIDYIPELLSKIRDAFTDYDWAGLGERIMQSIFDGINNIGGKAKEALSSAGEHILDALGFHPDGTFSLPMFADGGTLTSGSAIVGEAGPELLSVANGRAVVTPLTNGGAGPVGGIGTNVVQNITNAIYVDSISSDYDIDRINEQLAIKQRNALDAVGGW